MPEVEGSLNHTPTMSFLRELKDFVKIHWMRKMKGSLKHTPTMSFLLKMKQFARKPWMWKMKGSLNHTATMSFFPETEAVCAKSMDTKDEWLSESDTDDDFSAENVELVSHGHSHSEI